VVASDPTGAGNGDMDMDTRTPSQLSKKRQAQGVEKVRPSPGRWIKPLRRAPLVMCATRGCQRRDSWYPKSAGTNRGYPVESGEIANVLDHALIALYRQLGIGGARESGLRLSVAPKRDARCL
jgi:hypothetical protein